MFINRIYLVFLSIILLIAMMVFSVLLMLKEYRLYNIYGAPAGSRISLVEYYAGSLKDNFISQFITNTNDGLEIENWIIPEKSTARLLNDFPDNIKDWQELYYMYPNNEFHKAQMRFRGDNPNGWARDKKSIRIKLRKKRLINQQRVINYNLPQDQNILDTYLSYYIGKKAGLLTPEYNLIEARINGKYSGIFFKNTQIDETFLRRNNIMPVNLYKGEQYHTDKDLEKSNDLFNNPSLWTKLSVFNQRDEDDHRDLSYLFRITRLAENSEENFRELSLLADLEEWAKFSAYQTLLQTWHNMHDHNMRIVSDPWEVKFKPLVHDTGAMFLSESNENLIFETINHSLYEVYIKSSEFLYKKYNHLYNYLEKKILSDAANHVDTISSKLLNSWARDPYHTQFSLTNSTIKHKSDSDSMAIIIKNLSEQIRKRESALLAKLNQKPEVNWHYANRTFSLIVNSIVPVGEITLSIDGLDEKDIALYFDKDSNGSISIDDMEMPISVYDNEIVIHSNFLANRITFSDKYEAWPKVKISPTKFNILSNKDIKILKVYAKNTLSSEKFKTVNKNIDSNTPGRLNYPIIEKKIKSKIWKGVKTIDQTLIVDEPVIIEPGTTILMENEASIIFRNKLDIQGTIENPVQVLPANSQSIWGTFALQGKNSSGSHFSNLIMRGGSGYENQYSKYTGMLSFHDTKDVIVENLLLEDSKIYDDAIHIIYSSLIINNCQINNAFADAIDIDISSVIIKQCKIFNSGNDGIDSMSSRVSVLESDISYSGDKGISVGEGSDLNVISTFLKENFIGIENKDNSKTRVYKSDLIDNQMQINSYLKNWQYGGGGKIFVLDSNILPIKDKVENDKNTETFFFDERYSNKQFKQNKNIFFLNENSEVFNMKGITEEQIRSEINFNNNFNYYEPAKEN